LVQLMRQGSGQLAHRHHLRNLPQFFGQPADLSFNAFSFECVSDYPCD
jgi:hypothetical protein